MIKNSHALITLNDYHDEDGFLAVLEEKKTVPFVIRRVFYEYGLRNNNVRGKHANKNSQFCIIAVSGSCRVTVNDGIKDTIYYLDSPTKMLYLNKMVWKVMDDFSEDCILIILSDRLYDKSEYIRDFDEFVSEVLNN